MTYSLDRKWSDRFIPEIKRIVGPHLLSETPLEIDAKEAADLMVFTGRDLRIAARVRREGYAERYPFEFTIRAHRDSGAKTELAKIIEGWGDWMLYGHEGEGSSLSVWWLIDLHAFRASLIRCPKDLKFSKKANGDGTYFVAYDLRSFPPEPSILVAGSRDLPSWRAAA